MSEIVNCSIDLSKIDKSEIIDGKNGAKYYNFSVMISDEANQWGKNVSLSKPQTKEQREMKAKKEFIGSGVSVWRNGQTLKFEKNQTKEDDGLPF